MESEEAIFDAPELEAIRRALRAPDDRLVETERGGVRVCGQAVAGRLLFCHGAGAGHESVFLTRLRQALAGLGVQVIAIEFAYMRRRRLDGRRRPPPAIDKLVDELDAWQRGIAGLSPVSPMWIGGKSMGGRVASLLAARQSLPGLVLCGYPFHPPAKPERLRLDHWPQIDCPILLLQGTRDPFGRRDEVERYALPTSVNRHFLEGGDHDWVPPKRQASDQSALIDEAARLIARRLNASQ